MSDAIRSSASASCIRAIGRSNAASSSAWSVTLSGATSDAAHAGERVRRVDVAGPGDLERRVDPERAVEVEVELRLGHRAHERAQRALVEGHGGDGSGIGYVANRSSGEREWSIMRMTSSTFMQRRVEHVHRPRHRRQRVRRQPRRPGAHRRRARRRRARRLRGVGCTRRAAPGAGPAGEPHDPTRRRHRPASLPAALDGTDAIVHLAAIPRDWDGGASLRLVNTEGTRNIVRAATDAGVRRFVHLGALGVADEPDLHYASSKAKAMALVQASGLDWTILSPSLLFGPRDGFFNILAGLVRLSPGRDPDHRTRARRASSRWRSRTWHGSSSASSRTPPRRAPSTSSAARATWTYREIMGEVLRGMGTRRALLPVPVPVIRLVAGAMETLGIRWFPVATDQLRQLKLDNIGPCRAVREAFGLGPGRWRAASATSATRPRPGAGRTRYARGVNAARRTAAAVVWVLVAALVALGGAGVVAAMHNVPGTAARADLTWAADQAADAKLDAATERLAELSAAVESLGRREP